MRLLTFVLLAIVVFSHPVLADKVVPSDRVTNRLNVREGTFD